MTVIAVRVPGAFILATVTKHAGCVKMGVMIRRHHRVGADAMMFWICNTGLEHALPWSMGPATRVGSSFAVIQPPASMLGIAIKRAGFAATRLAVMLRVSWTAKELIAVGTSHACGAPQTESLDFSGTADGVTSTTGRMRTVCLQQRFVCVRARARVCEYACLFLLTVSARMRTRVRMCRARAREPQSICLVLSTL